MFPGTDDFVIDCSTPDRARLSGVLRLTSPADYEERFEPLRRGVTTQSAYTIDLSQVRFLNSSGITSLSRLVLLARSQNKDLTIVGSEAVSWHAKTLTLLKRLYDRLDVRLL